MVSPLILLLYVLAGPFAILKVCGKNLILQAYANQVILKMIASVISLGAGSQVVYKYYDRHLFIWLPCGLLTIFLNYWFLIPIALIYVLPIISTCIRPWFICVDSFSDNILRPVSLKCCQLLSAVWTFESNKKLWPLESIRFIITYGLIGPVLYCCFGVFSRLVFGTVFNLCITIAIFIVITKTIWRLLDAIDVTPLPFFFAIIIQKFLLPSRSLLNIPLTLLITMFLFPLLSRLLTGNVPLQIINLIKAFSLRALLETNKEYEKFYAEFVNLMVTIIGTSRVLAICWTSQVPWLLTMCVATLVFICLYIHTMPLISVVPNVIMFIISSILLVEFVAYSLTNHHFIYNFFLLIIIFSFHFYVIYPFIYHLLRRLVTIYPQFPVKSRHYLRTLRKQISENCSRVSEQHLRIIYIHQPSASLILHLFHLTVTLIMLVALPIHFVPRCVLTFFSYLLIGRLLLTHDVEFLGTIVALCTSVVIGASVFALHGHSVLLTMIMTGITYLSTIVVAFPLTYRLVQLILVRFPFTNHLDWFLKQIFKYTWSHFDIVWLQLQRRYYELKIYVEQGLNSFNRWPTIFR